MSLAPRVRMPDPPAPPVLQRERERPERELGGEREKTQTRARRKGRNALRIDRKAPGVNTVGATGLNIPTS